MNTGCFCLLFRCAPGRIRPAVTKSFSAFRFKKPKYCWTRLVLAMLRYQRMLTRYSAVRTLTHIKQFMCSSAAHIKILDRQTIYPGFSLCAGQDSNLRRHKPRGLQPRTFDHSVTDAIFIYYIIYNIQQAAQNSKHLWLYSM